MANLVFYDFSVCLILKTLSQFSHLDPPLAPLLGSPWALFGVLFRFIEASWSCLGVRCASLRFTFYVLGAILATCIFEDPSRSLATSASPWVLKLDSPGPPLYPLGPLLTSLRLPFDSFWCCLCSHFGS